MVEWGVSGSLRLRVGIVGWDVTEYESLHLVATSRARGHDTTLFTLDDVSWGAVGCGFGVIAAGRPAGEFDVIVSRAQLRRERWQSDLERLTLLSGLPSTPILDPAAEWVAAESKFVQHQRFTAAGLPVLPTACCASPDDVQAALKTWGDTVLKPSFGWEGNDVERVRADAPLPEVVAALLGRYGTVLAQPYVPHPEGDVRLTVVGGEVVIAFARIPPGDGWKSNVAQGARPELVTPSPAMVELALAATRAMNTTTAGIDIMRLGAGHVVIELNNGPGWHSLTPDAESTVANAIIAFAEGAASGGPGRRS
jgi:ribosomal protein S6--L-glutamate ligase